MTNQECYFCGTEIENVCPKCGAYKVEKGFENLKLKDQPYYQKKKKKKQ